MYIPVDLLGKMLGFECVVCLQLFCLGLCCQGPPKKQIKTLNLKSTRAKHYL